MLYNKKDEDIVQHILTRLETLEAARRPYEDKFIRYYKLYKSVIQNPKDYGSNVFIPYVFNIVETVKPRVINTMFAARPYVGLVSLDPLKQPNADVLTTYMDYQMVSKMKFVKQATGVIHNALIYGTGISKQIWKYKTKKGKSRQPILENGTAVGYNVVNKEKVVYDDPLMKNIDILDFYVDPNIETIEEQPDTIERYWLSKEELAGLSESWGFDVSLLDKISTSSAEAVRDGVSKRLSEIGYGDKPGDDMIEILEYWTDDEIIRVANREVVLLAEENPYWHGEKPYKKLCDVDVPGEFYGIGEIEPLEYLQEELNTLRNQRVDNINLIINKMYKILRGANIDPEQLVTRPGGFVEVDNMDELEEIQFTDVTQNAYQEDQMIKTDMDKTSGVYDYSRGASPTRRETATTATILTEAGNERFKLKIFMFETSWLVEVAKQITALDQQYVDTERVAAVVNDGQVVDVTVNPQNIEGEFEYMAVGSSIEPVYNKAAKQQSLMMLFQTLAQMPFVDLRILAKKLLQAYDIRDVASIIPEQQQAPGGVDPYMMMALMQGGTPQQQGQMVNPQQMQAAQMMNNISPDVMRAIMAQLMAAGQANGGMM